MKYRCRDGGIRQHNTSLVSQWKRFRYWQGYGGDKNPSGVMVAREGWRKVTRIESSRVMVGVMVMLGQRQVNPMLLDDPMHRHVGGGDVGSLGLCPPW